MPTFKVTDPNTGKTLRLTGDSPPTEQELEEIFSAVGTDSISERLKKLAKIPLRERAISGAIGGPVPAVGGATRAKESLPTLGQVMGSRFGFPGAVAGATLGEAGRQGVKQLRGEGGDLGTIAPTAAATAVAEGAFRIPGSVFFRKQIGGALREKAGRRVGRLIEKAKGGQAQFANLPKKPIINQIDEILDKVKFERGPQRSTLLAIKKRLMGIKRPLTFEEAVDLERELGRRASFAQTQVRQGKAADSPALNKAIKELRTKISAKVDELASIRGVPEFEKASKRFAGLVKKFPEKELQKKSIPLRTQLVAGGLGLGGAGLPFLRGEQRADPLAIAAVSPFFIPQAARTALFRNALLQAFGQGGRIGTSEIARRVSQ